MIKTMRIQRRLFAGFSIILVILILLLGTIYQNLLNLKDANQWDRHTLEVLLASDNAEAATLQITAEFSGFLLTGNELYIVRINDHENDFRRKFQQVTSLTVDNPRQQERLKKLDLTISKWTESVVHPMISKRRELAKTQGAADLVARDPLIAEGFKNVTDIRRQFADFSAEENQLLESRARQADSLHQSMRITIVSGGIICLVLAMGIAYLLSRSIIRPLDNIAATVKQLGGGNQSARAAVISQDELGAVTQEVNRMAQAIQDSQQRELAMTADLKSKVDVLLETVSKAASGDLTGKVEVTGNDAIGRLGTGLATMFDNLRALINQIQKAGIQVTTSATEIAASSKQQEATAVEQARTTIEVLSTTNEIAANSTQLLKTMQDASQVADYTTTATADAQLNLKRMDQTMQHMVNATDSINAKLAALSEKAGNINSVLSTITKVADQTNILSLNAAIEAEKAGEAGRGFSVVATEIRRLADQTSVATWDIEQMLKEMQSAVSASVMGMDKFSEEIRRSVDEARGLGDQLSTVIEQVQKLPPHFNAVFEGMQSQSIGASQISDTIRQLNDASQQTVESLRSTTEAVQQLQSAAYSLQTGVSNFSANA